MGGSQAERLGWAARPAAEDLQYDGTAAGAQGEPRPQIAVIRAAPGLDWCAMCIPLHAMNIRRTCAARARPSRPGGCRLLDRTAQLFGTLGMQQLARTAI